MPRSDIRALRSSAFPNLAAFLPWLIAAFVVVIYLPALANGFVWDDHVTLFQADAYRDPGVPYLAAFTRALVYSGNYYRPLPVLSFMFEMRMLGLDAWHYHLVSVVLHGINVALLAMAVRLYLHGTGWRGAIVTGASALLYGLHPALVEPVVFVASRFDLLATLFVLLALISDRIVRPPALRVAAVGAFFLLAALSKETVISFALALPLLHILAREQMPTGIVDLVKTAYRRGEFAVYLGIVAAGLVYLALRWMALGHILDPATVGVVPAGDVGQRLWLVGRSFYEYTTLIAIPFFGLGPSHPVVLPATLSDPRTALGTLLFLLALVVAGILIARKHRLGWWLAVWPASLFPILNFVPPPRPLGAFFAESYLVLPLALVTLATVLIVCRSNGSLRVPASSRTAALAVAVWGAISLFTIVTTIPVWRSDISLWSWALYRQPENTVALRNVVNGYLLQGGYDRALPYARRYQELAPDHSYAWTALANTFMGLERYAEAESAARRAIALDPVDHAAWTTLGDILRREQKYAAARDALIHALTLRPENYYARAKLSDVLFSLGWHREAQDELETVLASIPQGPERQSLHQLYVSRFPTRTPGD